MTPSYVRSWRERSDHIEQSQYDPGHPWEVALPATRVVTVLFTDLVGSTALSSRLAPDDGDRLREQHFATLREAIAAHGGTEVKNLGDGLMVAFDVASAALECAEAMQQAVARSNRASADPLAIRVGIALGEVTADAGDYFGDAVVEAARLCAAAEGDQILATQAAKLAAGRRARQPLVARGEMALKGLPHPVEVVEVVWERPSARAEEGPLPLPRRCSTAPTSGFVGRVAERDRLDLARKAVEVEGALRVVLISGEAGMGKTSLALECARAAHGDGAVVLYGRADEDVSVPYGPWAEAITHLATHAPPGVTEKLAPHGGSLARIAPALAPRFDGPWAGGADAETARYVLFGAVASALGVASELSPVVLVLDDLHWADAPSLQLLRYLVTTAPAIKLLVVATFRDAEVGAASPLADLLGALHREASVERLVLRGLDDVELLALMEAAAGQAMDGDGVALRDALAAETDGNPFFVGELLRHLAETGAIYQDAGRWVAATDLRDRGLPVSVVEVVGRRVARLGGPGGRVLAVASVIGRDFDLTLLARAAEVDEDELLDVMDQAVDAALVENVAGDRFTFVHALIEHTLYESLAPARRARLHRRVAEAIEDASGDDLDDRAAELAHHWGRATAPDDLAKALHYATAAGDDALRRLAPDEAVRWYGNALALLSGRDDDAQLRCRLLVGTGDAQRQLGDPAYRDTLLEAAHLAERFGDTDLLVAAALRNYRGFVSNAGVIDDERVAVLEAACRAVEGSGSAAEARLLGILANELIYGDDLPRRLATAERALAVARAVGDTATLAAVLVDVVQAINVPATLAQRIELAREAAALAPEVGDPLLQFWSALFLAMFLYTAGDVTEADQLYEVARSVATEVGQPLLRWLITFGDSCRAQLAGDLDRAERLSLEAADLATATGQPDATVFLGAQLSTVRIMQGRSDEVVELVQLVVAESPGVPAFVASLAMMYVDLDRPEDARRLLEPLAANGFAFPEDLAYLGGLGQATATIGELGWVEAASSLYERIRPWERQIYYNGLTAGVEMSMWLGVLASVLGRDDDADAHFARSVDTHQRIGAAFGLAATQVYWGRHLVSRGRPGDRERGVSLLQEATASADERGYGVIARRARAALGRAGSS